jgi:hypothetical protein
LALLHASPVGKAVLILVAWTRLRWLRRTSAGLASFLPSFLCALMQFGLVRGFLDSIAFLGTRLQDRFGFG